MKKTWVMVASAMLAACGDDSSSSTGGGGNGAGGGAQGGAGGEDTRLFLEFEPVAFDTELPYITDLAFTPDGSGDFLVTDLYGGIELGNLGSEGAEIRFSMTVPDVFAEYDAGLLALAIDPDFETNRYFYVSYNVAKNHVLLTRMTLDEADPAVTLASEVTILELEVPTSPRWHNITSMGFEPSGVMWVLAGDKGVAKPDAEDLSLEVPQDEKSLLGLLLRIVPSKAIGEGGYEPADDGKAYSPTSNPAIFAKGMRSPWQGIFHDGKWYYGEVGLDDIEEINVIETPGQNFGWPVVEGPCALDIFSNEPNCELYVDPWIYFNRSSSSPYVVDDLDAVPTNKRSVWAGWIYQPNELDPYLGRWNDVLVWGDAFVGFMRASRLGGDGVGWHLGHVEFPSAWAQAPDGYVYMIELSEEPDPQSKSPSTEPSPLWRALLKSGQ